MATRGTTAVTMADYLKSLDPDGMIAQIIEVLHDDNDIIADIPWKEGNLEIGHRHTIRAGLPTPTWRMLNYGTQPSKSLKKQVDDTCGMLQAVSDVDKDLVDLSNNKAAFRAGEDDAHLEGMNQELAEKLFYGNQQTDPEQITGFAPRYSVGSTAQNTDTTADNVINGGGTGSDNTSVWLVTWGDKTAFGIFPKGLPMGFEHVDRGLTDLVDANGGVYLGYRSFYKWKVGLGLADWRYVARLANIDVSLLKADDGTVSAGVNLINSMIKLIHRIPKRTRGSKVFYVNEVVYLYLDLQTKVQSTLNVTYGKDLHGHEVMMFRGIPVRQCDALINTEEAITFS